MSRSARPSGAGMEMRQAVATASWLGIAVLAGACAGPADDSTSEASLTFVPENTAVVCDETERLAGHVVGAEPGEAIVFASDLPITIDGGTADPEGRYPIRWSCDRSEARLRWDLTATGRDSGRSVAFAIVGAGPGPDDTELAVALHDDEVVCDGVRHDVGTLSGGEPDEGIDFDSDQTSGLHSGRADGRGELVFGWSCRPGDVGRTWEVTATGAASGRTATFVLRGIAPETTPAIEVDIVENPFICDGSSRAFARLSNLVPEEVVTFTAPGTDGLRDGRAGSDGTLDLNWQCGPEDVGTTWNLTATGTESGRTAELVFTGAADPQGPTAPPAVEASLSEDPFVCDGDRRPVAHLSNLLPGEFVDFSSPQAGNLREGRADGSGSLVVNWQCESDELGPDGSAAWDLTATGRESQLSATLRITGTGS